MFKLGDKVWVKSVMYPTKPLDEKTNMVVRRWNKRNPYEGQGQGIVAGVRVVKEGYSEYWYEEGCTFNPTKHIKVYLVAVSLGQMVKVLPEDLELIKSDPAIRS